MAARRSGGIRGRVRRKGGRADNPAGCVGQGAEAAFWQRKAVWHVDRDGLDFVNVTLDEYDTIMNINLKGTYFMCQTVAKYMIENKIKGHILIISSQSALEPSWSPYRLSKLGIDGITKGMAQRLLEHGIIVNAIGPGPTNTSMQKNYREGNLYTPLNPIKRFTTPEEIAQIAKILVSDLGNTIVGQTIYMSGGRGIVEIR